MAIKTKTIMIVAVLAILMFALGFVIGYEPEESIEVAEAATITTTTQPKPEPKVTQQAKKDELQFDGLSSNWYVYMDLDAITNPTTPQYERKKLYWLSSQGLWCCGNDYVVAMGSAWGEVGTRYEVTTNTGNRYTVVIGDTKADMHTDGSNRYTLAKTSIGDFANVIEFIVNVETLPQKPRITGNIGCLTQFNGDIVSLRKLS